MFVCLCAGVTNQMVAAAVDAGASTSKEVADSCGAGAECGRCRRTVRAIIDARRGAEAPVRLRDAPDQR
jgi:bacterioferritin-associated ferredoxin